MNGFGAQTTAAEVVAGRDLSGLSVIVTGGASGIGVETARALASAGASVTLAVRNLPTGKNVAEALSRSGSGAVDARELDLADLGSIDAFVAGWDRPLDVLVNNAGVMNVPERYTPAGWELQFATNHLGHFALSLGLHPALADGGHGRIVVVSSSGHGASPVIFDDLFFERRDYEPGLAYGQSKTANVLFAVEATRRWSTDGITANALMPGGIWTNLQRYWDPDELKRAKNAGDGAGVVKTPGQGAATSVLLATSPVLEGVGGRYFEDCGEAAVVGSITDGLHGVREYALDTAAAQRLWDVSSGLVSAARRAQGANSQRVVERLVHAIVERRFDDARRLLAPGAVFINGALGEFTGPDAIVAVLDAAGETMDSIDWRLERTAARGATVFTERRDRFGRAGKWAEIPVTGVFEVVNGQVSSWHDYYDALEGQVALDALPAHSSTD